MPMLTFKKNVLGWIEKYPRSIIFITATLVRCIIGYIFYGSIDVSAFIGINAHTFNNTLSQYPFSIWCSFPVIPFYLWFCGVLGVTSCLPLAFCFKLIPIFFDGLLAVLLYDLIKNIRPVYAFKTGMLYALSPFSIIITCIHGQWEAMQIFFFLLALYIRTCYQDSYKKYFLYGLLFAFSFLLKPLSLVFIVFFFIPWSRFKKDLGRLYGVLIGLGCAFVVLLFGLFVMFKLCRTISLDVLARNIFESPMVITLLFTFIVLVAAYLIWLRPWAPFPQDFKQYLGCQIAGVLGALTMITFVFAMFALYGFNILRIIDKVFRYFNQGIYVFGLPAAYPFNQGLLALILKNRFWIMGIIGVFAYLYYKEKFDVYYAVLCSLLVIFGFSGLSPQYLLWLLPLLLLTGFYRVAAILNIVSVPFFLLYYMNPLSNPEVPYQSMFSFTALKSCVWFMPPQALTSEAWLPLIRLLGNYGIPCVCLATLGWILIMLRGRKLGLMCPQKKLIIMRNGYLLVPVMLTLGIAIMMLFVDASVYAARFRNLIATGMDRYDVSKVNGFLCGNYGSLHLFNIVFILFVMAVVWSWVVWKVSTEPKNVY